MARKVTDEDISKMLELYNKIGTYAGVAREIGYSSSTVRKYIVEAQQSKPPEIDESCKFDPDKVEWYEPPKDLFENGENYRLTEDEKHGIEELWKELGR